MRRRTIFLAAALCGALALLPGIPARSGPDGEIHFPDLRTLQPSEARLSPSVEGTELRFTNAIWNQGEGPLEVRPQNDPETETTTAFQLLFTHDEQDSWAVVEERDAGTFEFHPQHDHWHFSSLADYSIRRMSNRGTPTDEVISSSNKIGFCMFDEFDEGVGLEHQPADPHYEGRNCDQSINQGYSVGWGDTYRYNFPGQTIDVTDVEPGDYILYSEADPNDLLIETNEENNTAWVRIRLEEDAVRVVTRTRARICSPCGREKVKKGRTYTLRGTTRPAEEGQPLRFDFRKGKGGWTRFEPDKPFELVGTFPFVERDGTWAAQFKSTKRGRWQIRVRAAKTERSTASTERLSVRVVR